jgi:hypothetical protein
MFFARSFQLLNQLALLEICEYAVPNKIHIVFFLFPSQSEHVERRS